MTSWRRPAKQLYSGPPATENADVERLVQAGVLEPVAGALPPKSAKNDEVRNYLLTVMSARDADDLIAHRRARKCPLTRRAAEGLVRHFSAAQKQFGWPVATCIDHMTSQGWQGFNSNWIVRDKAQTQAAVNKASRCGGAVGALERLITKKAGQDDRRGSEIESGCLDPERLSSVRKD